MGTLATLGALGSSIHPPSPAPQACWGHEGHEVTEGCVGNGEQFKRFCVFVAEWVLGAVVCGEYVA